MSNQEHQKITISDNSPVNCTVQHSLSQYLKMPPLSLGINYPPLLGTLLLSTGKWWKTHWQEIQLSWKVHTDIFDNCLCIGSKMCTFDYNSSWAFLIYPTQTNHSIWSIDLWQRHASWKIMIMTILTKISSVMQHYIGVIEQVKL